MFLIYNQLSKATICPVGIRTVSVFQVHINIAYLYIVGIDDPGVKGQIFEGMTSNDKGLREVNGDFLTINPQVKCDSAWQRSVYHDWETFRMSKTTGSLIGFDSSLGEDLRIPYRPALTVPITAIFKMPTLLSRASSLDNRLDQLTVS